MCAACAGRGTFLTSYPTVTSVRIHIAKSRACRMGFKMGFKLPAWASRRMGFKLPAWASRKFKGWNHSAPMPWRVELELLGLPRRFGTNRPVLDYFL
jgi:hypothetical protein